MSDEPNLPGGLYNPCVFSEGPLLHLAGQTARRGEKMLATGIVGDTVDLETAQGCACQCVDNLLAHAVRMLDGEKRIRRVVQLNVFIAATADFADHSKVADAASKRIVEFLGERGIHARSAIGVVSLPRQSPVEIDAVFEVCSNGNLVSTR